MLCDVVRQQAGENSRDEGKGKKHRKKIEEYTLVDEQKEYAYKYCGGVGIGRCHTDSYQAESSFSFTVQQAHNAQWS